MKSLKRVFDSRELLWNLTLRELRTKYRRSLLGWAWSMLNPLATVAIYSFVFGVLFESSAPVGDPSGLKGFAYFLLCLAALELLLSHHQSRYGSNLCQFGLSATCRLPA